MKRLICRMLLPVLLACAVIPALAEMPLTIEISLSRYEFTQPGNVTVEILVTNTSGKDMPGPCVLYNPSGRRIEAFGTPTLAAGESRSWSGTWPVSKEQLQQGRITFALALAVQDDSGRLVTRTQSFWTPISYVAQLDTRQMTQLMDMYLDHAILLLQPAMPLHIRMLYSLERPFS